MEIESARLQKYLKISQMMLRLAQEQKWTELWALQVERVKLFPDGLARDSGRWTREQMSLIGQSDTLDNQIQTEVQKASGNTLVSASSSKQRERSSNNR